MSYLRILAGGLGCDDQVGAGTFTAQGGKKIVAVGIVADAEITSFDYTKTHTEKVMTVDGLAWQGVSLIAAVGANAFIPLGYKADSVIVASGTVRMFYG